MPAACTISVQIRVGYCSEMYPALEQAPGRLDYLLGQISVLLDMVIVAPRSPILSNGRQFFYLSCGHGHQPTCRGTCSGLDGVAGLCL